VSIFFRPVPSPHAGIAARAMILIDPTNKTVLQFLQRKVDQPAVALDEKCGDFNGAAWHVVAADGTGDCVVSLRLGAGVTTLRALGVDEYLRGVLGGVTLLPVADTEAQYDFSVRLNCAAASPDALTKVASLRRHALALPFLHAFDKFEAGVKFDPIVLEVRPKETIELSATKDNVVVRYVLAFEDDRDLLNARILMQEFVDVKRHEKTVSAAPGVAWKFDDAKQAVTVEFVLFKSHTGAKVRDRTIDRLVTFRTYVHYHLMCSKSYIHSRMRTRVEESLKVLNRAKAHGAGQAIELIR